MPKNKRYQACACGRCGLIWDMDLGLNIIQVPISEDGDKTISEPIRQKAMADIVESLNEFNKKGKIKYDKK